jgi:hypothetical protein
MQPLAESLEDFSEGVGVLPDDVRRSSVDDRSLACGGLPRAKVVPSSGLVSPIRAPWMHAAAAAAFAVLPLCSPMSLFGQALERADLVSVRGFGR